MTSAVREIPTEWATIPRLTIVVSVDGLQPEHDVRRTPATYDRILKHIDWPPDRRALHGDAAAGQSRPATLKNFCSSGRRRPETRKIWISLYTPQIGEVSEERLLPADRAQVVADLKALRLRYPKLEAPMG